MVVVTSHPPDDNTPPSSGTVHTGDVARAVATLPISLPTGGNVGSPPRPAGWRSPATRTGYPPPVPVATSPVGFSPTGDVPPDALTDVLVRGSYAIRSSKRSEVERAERAASIARHVEAQIAAFLEMCTAAELLPPITVRVVADVPPAGWVSRRDNRPQEIYALSLGAAATAAREGDGWQSGGRRRLGRRAAGGQRGIHHAPTHGMHQPRIARRERLRAWPVLYWRCESFPSTGRSLHLFVAPGGRLFEGRDDPWPLTVAGRHVRVWPVDPAVVVGGMAEVDARRCALHLVHEMAHLLWRAGISL